LALFLFDLLDLLFDFDNLFRDIDVGQMDPAPHFVQGVNGLVWEMAVGDVPTGQRHACSDGFVGVLDAVVLLVLVLDVVKDLLCLLNGGGLHHDLLEPPL
jgi:hypothetical protein